MKTMLISVIVAACMSAALAASLQPHESETENLAELEQESPQDTRLSWLRYLIQQNRAGDLQQQPQPHHAQEKRFTSFGMPYIKYRVDKRNNGVWIWMPAQGYVSVPKQQQSLTEDASSKQGKIMRYGK